MDMDIKPALPCLSSRLLAIAENADTCERVVDVGTDHALIPVYLLNKGICKSAIASDIRKGPLKAAERNIKKFNVSERVKLVLTDGLEGISVNNDDIVVISGIGGYEIISILEKTDRKPLKIIVQPQKSERELRTFLSGSGYEITRETIVRDGKRYYVIIKALFTGVSYELDDVSKVAGPYILSEKPPNYYEYIAYLIEKIKKHSRGDKTLNATEKKLKEIFNKYENQ